MQSRFLSFLLLLSVFTSSFSFAASKKKGALGILRGAGLSVEESSSSFQNFAYKHRVAIKSTAGVCFFIAGGLGLLVASASDSIINSFLYSGVGSFSLALAALEFNDLLEAENEVRS